VKALPRSGLRPSSESATPFAGAEETLRAVERRADFLPTVVVARAAGAVQTEVFHGRPWSCARWLVTQPHITADDEGGVRTALL
jgi:hypothetical protein